jgi:hypothetical protein
MATICSGRFRSTRSTVAGTPRMVASKETARCSSIIVYQPVTCSDSSEQSIAARRLRQSDRLPQGLLPVDPCRLVFVRHRALDALPRRASNFHPVDSRIDLNELAKTSGMAQGPKPLESIRSMISLLHDDPRQDGESGSIDVGDSTLPSRDSLRRRVEQVG